MGVYLKCPQCSRTWSAADDAEDLPNECECGYPLYARFVQGFRPEGGETDG